MLQARCDVIALQEVPGESKRQARIVLESIAEELLRRGKRPFKPVVDDSNDEHIRNGFLTATDKFKLKDVRSYAKVPAPKLQPLGPPAYFPRGPLGVVLEGSGGKILFAVTMHLKSKASSWKDPTGTDFEAVRMQLAEALRKLALAETAELGSRARLVLLGDRNSPEQSASAEVLSGVRRLEDFIEQGGCSLNRKLAADCGERARRPGELIGLLSLRKTEAPEKYQGGSYRYKRKEELLDEILVRPADVPLFRRPDGSLAVGFRGSFYRGSDHKLVWAEMRW